MSMHRLLDYQIKKHLGIIQSLPEGCQDFLKAVDLAYRDFDENYSLMEKAQDIIMQELKAQSRQNELLLQSAGDGIIRVNLAGEIVYINPAGLRLLGYAKHELLNRSFHAILLHSHSNGNPYWEEASPLKRALTNSACYRQSNEVFWKKGRTPIPVDYTCTPILDQGEVKGAVIIFKNISDQIHARRALERYTQELEEGQKNLEDFVCIASHDLKEPLRKISSFGELLTKRMGSKMEPNEKEYLSRMINASDRMEQLISHLLEFSEIGIKSLKPEEVNLKSLINEVNLYLETVIEKTQARIKVISNLKRFKPIIQADRNQMYQLFQNLISNSLKYHRPGVPPEINILIYPQDQNFLKVHIQDNGIGFEQSQAHKIFKPFERLHGKSEYEGTGMGLSICQKIVTRHGGKIDVTSQPGKGTTFTINLPVKQSSGTE